MLDRLLGLVLIVAVITCPLQCARGLCHAGPRSVDTKEPNGTAGGTASCCCQNKSSHNDNERGPCSCPKKSCQGVCGGAILEKPLELLYDVASPFQPLFETELIAVPQLTDCSVCGEVHRCSSRGDNQGRSLRTLHVSLLC